jgi:SNF2 family DNA or RNA helicase
LDSGKNYSQSAIIPYNISMVKSGQKLFTLYTSRSGKVSVSTENLDNWPHLNNLQPFSEEQPLETLDPSDLFSYLMQKYPVQGERQDTLPLYGDSGSEGEFDEETWQEIEDERQGLPQKPTKLTPAEIESVMRDCISKYEKRWHEIGLPKEQHKARKLWLRAKKGRYTNQEIKRLSQKSASLEKRLRKLQEAVRGSQYATKSELETQCQNMEFTVMDMQRQRWCISVLEQETCPPSVSAPPKPPSTQQSERKLADEESLNSETGDVFNDSMDDFIDKSDNEDRIHSMEIDNRTRITPIPESDDDVISPSGARRRSRARKLPFLQSSSPSPPPVHGTEVPPEYIDLTRDSPAPEHEYTIETPPLNPVPRALTQAFEDPIKSEKSASISPGPELSPRVIVQIPIDKQKQYNLLKAKKQSSLPDIHDVDKLMSVPWDLLEERQDRRRLLAKLIASLSAQERKKMAKSVPRYSGPDLQKLTKTALKYLRKSQDKIPELDAAESSLIMRIASLFISWVNCVHFPSEGIPKKKVQNAQGDINSFFKYHNELCNCLAGPHAKDSNMHPSSVSGGTPESADTPHKKRKREIKESQTAKKSQQNAQLRVALQEKQRKLLEQKIGIMNTDPARQAVSFGDPALYLDPYIGLRVKPHQLNGIQFLWRELIEDEKQQGCLLAHTMGLGKTMQVISLLATISAAASSDDISINQQVPTAFHKSQTLILCPSSLVENWYEEFHMWTPESSNIGPLRKITTAFTLQERLQEVSDWNEEGGVLIMSYDLFRTWILNRETNKRGKPLSDSDFERVRECLLEGPNIIVADEAHKMKNPFTGISKAAMQFRSKSRIALTGSPLANNLVDYFAMVNWIAEGYLGDFVEFKAKFVEPIQEGLYVDSTYTERRRSLVKLQVLKEILAPKINRADTSVLAGSLPTKVEFVITVPLTNLQKEAYNTYVGTIMQGKGEVGSAQLWSWLAILSLCCNHPTCFRDKLLSRASDAQKLDKKLEELEMLPGDEPIAQAGLPDSEKLVFEQEQIFATVPDIKALDLSHRARILDLIIDESIKAGDKVLVFSHSIPTLNYIESILRASGRGYARLDGQTPVVSRQAATKKFNSGSEQQVYLISTRAGGLGLNIPGANRVIIFDFSFSPVWEEQAVGRAYRLGQQKPVFVYRFIAGGTFEEVMYNKAVFKTQLAFRVVDKKNPVRWASKSLGEYLFPAKSVPCEDVTEYLGRDPQVLDKIIMNDGSEFKAIRKIALTETFQKEDNDKLTDEERQGVQQQLSDERLRREDPEAYHKLMVERQREAFAIAQVQKSGDAPPYENMQYIPSQPQLQYPLNTQPTIPSSAHNTGPPALGPDMSISQEPYRNETTAPYTPYGLSPPGGLEQANPQLPSQLDGVLYEAAPQQPPEMCTGMEITDPSRSPDEKPKNPCNPQ